MSKRSQEKFNNFFYLIEYPVYIPENKAREKKFYSSPSTRTLNSTLRETVLKHNNNYITFMGKTKNEY